MLEGCWQGRWKLIGKFDIVLTFGELQAIGIENVHFMIQIFNPAGVCLKIISLTDVNCPFTLGVADEFANNF